MHLYSLFLQSKLSLLLNEHWFLPAEVSLKKREHIRKLIYRVIEDNALKDPPDDSNNKYLQELGKSEVESSAKSIPKNSGEESCCSINFNAADDLDIMGKHCFVPMLERRNFGKSATKECCQPCKLLVPINQFNNLSLPLEVIYIFICLQNWDGIYLKKTLD